MPFQSAVGTPRKSLRIDDDVRFIRSWIEKPLAIGAVMPSSKPLARVMASYVDPASDGPVVELGPGTGAITEALVEHGIAESRLVLVEYDRTFCRLLRARYPAATVVQGDAYRLRRSLGDVLQEKAAAVVSGLPLLTKPLWTRLRLLNEVFGLLRSGCPFVQFTYSVAPPIPRQLARIRVEASERIWLNLPPARVWVYRRREVEPAVGRCLA